MTTCLFLIYLDNIIIFHFKLKKVIYVLRCYMYMLLELWAELYKLIFCLLQYLIQKVVHEFRFTCFGVSSSLIRLPSKRNLSDVIGTPWIKLNSLWPVSSREIVYSNLKIYVTCMTSNFFKCEKHYFKWIL